VLEVHQVEVVTQVEETLTVASTFQEFTVMFSALVREIIQKLKTRIVNIFFIFLYY
jgi:hypothetical protein